MDRSFPDRVFWGDTHVHSSYSTDAGMIGNVLGPEEAFRFARGEKVRASLGTFAQLVRPLDFLVVADHAENLGLAPMIAESNPQLLANPWGREIHDLARGGQGSAAYVLWGQSMVDNTAARGALGGSGVRSRAASVLLRARARDSDAVVAAVGRGVLR